MATLKQLKKALKKAGLKTSGSKRALTLRAKKAHVMRGGQPPKPSKKQEKQGDKQPTPPEAKAAAEEAESEAVRANAPAAALADAERRAAMGERAIPGGTRKRTSKKASKLTKKRKQLHLTASAYRY